MTNENLLKVVYNYFPKGIDCIKEKKIYVETKEYKRLSNHIKSFNNPYSKEIDIFIEEIKNLNFPNFSFNDSSYFEWEDRCYTFEFCKEINGESFILRVYLSILKPYFTIKFFKINVENDRHIYNIISSKSFPEEKLILELKNILEKHSYKEFDESLLSERIFDINFQDINMGEFTFFNAFFVNQLI